MGTVSCESIEAWRQRAILKPHNNHNNSSKTQTIVSLKVFHGFSVKSKMNSCVASVVLFYQRLVPPPLIMHALIMITILSRKRKRKLTSSLQNFVVWTRAKLFHSDIHSLTHKIHRENVQSCYRKVSLWLSLFSRFSKAPEKTFNCLFFSSLRS